MAHDSHDAHAKDHTGKLTERRFTAEPSGRANFQALIGGLGVAALGAGTYGTWMHDVPMPIAPWLFGAGTLAVVIASVMGSADSLPIRVGDAGVAVEHGGAQPERIAWYEVESVSLEDEKIVVKAGTKRSGCSCGAPRCGCRLDLERIAGKDSQASYGSGRSHR